MKTNTKNLTRRNKNLGVICRYYHSLNIRAIKKHVLRYILVVICVFVVRLGSKGKLKQLYSREKREALYDSEEPVFGEGNYAGIDPLDYIGKESEETYNDGSFFDLEEEAEAEAENEGLEVMTSTGEEPIAEDTDIEEEDDDEFQSDPDEPEAVIDEEIEEVNTTAATADSTDTSATTEIPTTTSTTSSVSPTTSSVSAESVLQGPVIAIDPALLESLGYKPPDPGLASSETTTTSSSSTTSVKISSESVESVTEKLETSIEPTESTEPPETKPTEWIPVTKKGQNLPLPPCKHNADYCPSPSFNVINPNAFYKTDPDKYLIPIVKWGPNNQILGFYEAMDLARQLNRTLVFTPMFKHATDKTNKQTSISYDVRLNVDGISSFVSSVSWQEAHVKCHDGLIDTVYLPQWMPPGGPPVERVKEFEDCTNFNIFNQTMLVHPKTHHVQFRNGVTTYPNNKLLYDLKTKLGVVGADDQVRKNITFVYDTPEKCAILAMPYKLLKPFKPNVIAKRFKAYDLPKYIEDMVWEFEQTIVDEMDVERDDLEYVFDVTMHWRYNKGDWSNRCMSTARGGGATAEQTASRQEQCKLLKDINATFVASCITDWWELTETQSEAEVNERINVYIGGGFEYKLHISKPTYIQQDYSGKLKIGS